MTLYLLEMELGASIIEEALKVVKVTQSLRQECKACVTSN
jgi:hypothetical protein